MSYIPLLKNNRQLAREFIGKYKLDQYGINATR